MKKTNENRLLTNRKLWLKGLITINLCVILVICSMSKSTAGTVSKPGSGSINAEFLLSGLNNYQQYTVTGIIKDASSGEALTGVTILVKGTTTGQVSDADGKFSIRIPDRDATLQFSFIGYTPQEIKVQQGTVVNVSMVVEVSSLEEVLVVGFGTQKKVSNVASIVSVKTPEIRQSPAPNIVNTLTGKLPGLTVIQRSGRPGGDTPYIRIRGIGTLTQGLESEPLILVDGVERNMDQLDPNEIESISLLKDASATAVYGVRGANGVILVTTKHGTEGPAQINFSSSAGINVPTRLPEFIHSYEYATYYNEAQLNDGASPGSLKYTPEALEHIRLQDDPILYPDTDWWGMLLKPYSSQTQQSVNISGSTKSIKYYIGGGYFKEDGLWKNFDMIDYDNTTWFKRYNFRSNITYNLTSSTVLTMDLSGRNEIRHSQNISDSEVMWYINLQNPLSPVGWYEDKFYMSVGSRSPIYLLAMGYQNSTTNTLETNYGLKQNLDFITEGLSFRVRFAYDNTYRVSRSRGGSFDMYSPRRITIDGIESLVFDKTSTKSPMGNISESSSKGIQNYLEAALEYSRLFNKHDVYGMILFTQQKQFNLVPPHAYQGFVGRFSYKYANKYLFEYNAGYNGSENFPKGKRFGFFPSYSAGWIASEESFIKNVPFISFLKFRASYGTVGNDRYSGRRFMYLPSSASFTSRTYYFGDIPTAYNGAQLGTIGNPDVGWEVAKKQNYAVELRLFRSRLGFNFDYFRETRENILIARSSVPDYAAALVPINGSSYPEYGSLPTVNMGKVENHGYEIELNWREDIGAFNYWLKGNYAFARNKILYMDEPISDYPNLMRTGHPVGQYYGYVIEKFVMDKAEADAINATGKYELGTLVPGDFKYSDVNGDGRINSNDATAIGYNTIPEITGGFSGGIGWKGLSANFLLQGATNVSAVFALETKMMAIDGNSAMKWMYDARWTPETATTATYPRGSLLSGHQNYYDNSYFIMDASYIRLKTFELAYNFNKAFLDKLRIESLGIHINGMNLITLDRLRNFDPEVMPGRRQEYPCLKIYNIGIDIGF